MNGLAEEDGIPDYGYNYPEVTLWYGSNIQIQLLGYIYQFNDTVSLIETFFIFQLMSDYPSEVNLEDQYF